MINITINGKRFEIPEGRTILEVCREEQIDVPTLCYHPALEPYGACRLCMVEITQSSRPPRLAASCVTPCEEGMQIETDSAEVLKSRRMTVELLLSENQDSPQLKAIAAELGVSSARHHYDGMDGCILCGLCVRACNEIVGVNAISTIYRGFVKKVSAPFQIESETCIGCGTCVLVCPTDAIKFEDISGFVRIRQGSGQQMASHANGGSNGKALVMRALRARQKIDKHE